MTLIVAAQGNDEQGNYFVVLGADTRETVDVGTVRVEVNIAEKFYPLTSHAAILMCGDSGHAQYLITKFRQKIKGKRERGVTRLVEDFSTFCQLEAIERSRTPTVGNLPPNNRYVPNIGFVIGGLDLAEDKFVLPMCYGLSSYRGYAIELGGGGFILDGKPMIARYLFAKEYRAGLDLDTVTNLVLKCLYDTARVDGDVGGKYRFAIIDSNGIRTKTEEEIDDMIDEAHLQW